MKPHNPELISALLDGELKGLRRWLVQRHVGRCAVCAAEYRHLHHVQQMLQANPVTPPLSDSPEFFWSKVKRDIQAQAGATENIPVPHLRLTDWLGQHRYSVAGATVTVLIALSLVFGNRKAPLATVAHLETELPNTTATAFEAQDAEVTVIWVSGLPWTKDMHEMQTLYATL